MPRKKTNYEKRGLLTQIAGSLFSPQKDRGEEGSWRPRKKKFEKLDGDDDEDQELIGRAFSIESDTGEYRRENLFDQRKAAVQQVQSKKRDLSRIALKPSARDHGKGRVGGTKQKKARKEQPALPLNDERDHSDAFGGDPFFFEEMKSSDESIADSVSRHTSSSKHTAFNTIQSDPSEFFSSQPARLTQTNLEIMAAMSAEVVQSMSEDDGIENVNPRSKFYQFTIDEDKESTVILPVGDYDSETPRYESDDEFPDEDTEHSLGVTSKGTQIQKRTRDSRKDKPVATAPTDTVGEDLFASLSSMHNSKFFEGDSEEAKNCSPPDYNGISDEGFPHASNTQPLAFDGLGDRNHGRLFEEETTRIREAKDLFPKFGDDGFGVMNRPTVEKENVRVETDEHGFVSIVGAEDPSSLTREPSPRQFSGSSPRHGPTSSRSHSLARSKNRRQEILKTPPTKPKASTEMRPASQPQPVRYGRAPLSPVNGLVYPKSAAKVSSIEKTVPGGCYTTTEMQRKVEDKPDPVSLWQAFISPSSSNHNKPDPNGSEARHLSMEKDLAFEPFQRTAVPTHTADPLSPRKHFQEVNERPFESKRLHQSTIFEEKASTSSAYAMPQSKRQRHSSEKSFENAGRSQLSLFEDNQSRKEALGSVEMPSYSAHTVPESKHKRHSNERPSEDMSNRSSLFNSNQSMRNKAVDSSESKTSPFDVDPFATRDTFLSGDNKAQPNRIPSRTSEGDDHDKGMSDEGKGNRTGPTSDRVVQTRSTVQAHRKIWEQRAQREAESRDDTDLASEGSTRRSSSDGWRRNSADRTTRRSSAERAGRRSSAEVPMGIRNMSTVAEDSVVLQGRPSISEDTSVGMNSYEGTLGDRPIGIQSFPKAMATSSATRSYTSSLHSSLRYSTGSHSNTSQQKSELYSYGMPTSLSSHVEEDREENDGHDDSSNSKNSSSTSYVKPLGLPNNAIVASMLFRRHHNVDTNAVEAKIKAKEEENRTENHRGDIPRSIHARDDAHSVVSGFSDDTAMLDSWRKPTRDLLEHFSRSRKVEFDFKKHLKEQRAQATALFEA